MTGLQQRLKETEVKAKRLMQDKVKRERKPTQVSNEEILSDALRDFDKKLEKIKWTDRA
jgi:hypothetical protein